MLCIRYSFQLYLKDIDKDIHRLKVKEQEKIFHANVSQKGVRVIIFMAEKNRQSQKLSQETKKDIMQ